MSHPVDWFVYVLLNDADVTYTGIAKDVAARLTQHNAGTGAKFTRGRGPWRIVHTEGPMEHGDALRKEIKIKRDASFKSALKVAAVTAQSAEALARLVAENIDP